MAASRAKLELWAQVIQERVGSNNRIQHKFHYQPKCHKSHHKVQQMPLTTLR